jgi:PTH1 family peptidyl-tRNA hydrolase
MMADSSLKLVVGLGNPGAQYAYPRHNAGFWLVDVLAHQYDGCFRTERKFGADVCRVRVGEQDLWLFKPTNFMNRSGESVVRILSFYQIPCSALLVAHDDLDLAPGVVRVKRSGGHGGHNGLRDIIKQLGTNQFLRLRLGIGHPGHSSAVTGYVLHRAPLDEQQLILNAIQDTGQEFPLLVAGQLDKAMHTLHSRQIESALADKSSDRASP